MNAKTTKALAVDNDFDIDQFEDTEAGKVYIKNPETGAPTPFYIEFAGPEHATRKRLVMNKQRKMRQHLQKTGKLQLQDPLQDEEEGLDMLVACALSWNLKEEFTPANVEKRLSDPKRRWLRDQMQTGFDERENFIARSAES